MQCIELSLKQNISTVCYSHTIQVILESQIFVIPKLNDLVAFPHIESFFLFIENKNRFLGFNALSAIFFKSKQHFAALITLQAKLAFVFVFYVLTLVIIVLNYTVLDNGKKAEGSIFLILLTALLLLK